MKLEERPKFYLEMAVRHFIWPDDLKLILKEEGLNPEIHTAGACEAGVRRWLRRQLVVFACVK